jgi:hypothetical protein
VRCNWRLTSQSPARSSSGGRGHCNVGSQSGSKQHLSIEIALLLPANASYGPSIIQYPLLGYCLSLSLNPSARVEGLGCRVPDCQCDARFARISTSGMPCFFPSETSPNGSTRSLGPGRPELHSIVRPVRCQCARSRRDSASCQETWPCVEVFEGEVEPGGMESSVTSPGMQDTE